MEPHFKSRRGTHNSLPPSKLWKKIGPTLKVIDKLCDEIGLPVKEIVSAYRSPEYNKAVRGKSRSYHMSNQALDAHGHTHKLENQERLNLEELSQLTMNKVVYDYFFVMPNELV